MTNANEASAAPTLPEPSAEIRDAYPDLIGLNLSELLRIRNTIIGDRSNVRELDDAELHKLSATLALIRRQKSGPPRAAQAAKAARKKKYADIGDFALE